MPRWRAGYEYIAITDHSKNLAMTNGLDEKRALEHIARIREVDAEMEGRIRVFAGIEVDILADGALDLDDEVLAQMDVVIASVHTRFGAEPRGDDGARDCAPSRILTCGSWAIPRAGCCCGASRLRWIWARCCGAQRSWALRWSITPRRSGWT